MEFNSCLLKYSLNGCWDQISKSHSYSYQFHKHLKLNSPIDFCGGEKKIHCHLLTWKFFYHPLAMLLITLRQNFKNRILPEQEKNHIEISLQSSNFLQLVTKSKKSGELKKNLLIIFAYDINQWEDVNGHSIKPSC